MQFTLPLASGYLLGSLLLGIPYLFMYLLRPDLRKQLVWGGLVCLPLAFTAPLYIPEYWNPPYYFGKFGNLNLGIEDFIFSFFVGGIASSIYEFVSNKKITKLPQRKGQRRNWQPYGYGIGYLCMMELLLPQFSILTLASLGPLVALYMSYFRPDLRQQSLFAGALFALFYFLFFLLFISLFPSYIELIYHKTNLLQLYVGEIPIEELFFAFSVGCGWSILYEYVLGYRESS